MKPFRFSLERVRQWRSTQVRLEEEKLAQHQNELRQLAIEEQSLAAVYQQNAARVVSSESLDGAELQALSQFRERTNRMLRELRTRRATCEALLSEQRQRLLKARKEHQVLENLKDRQFKSWSYEMERDLESTVADNYLSSRYRGQTP